MVEEQNSEFQTAFQRAHAKRPEVEQILEKAPLYQCKK